MRRASLFENALTLNLFFAVGPILCGARTNELDECPVGCSSHGVCRQGLCQCHGGWTGQDCSYFLADSSGDDERLEEDEEACLDGCSGHGSCNGGMCHCNLGWAGMSCNLAAECPSSCGRNGKCVAGACVCAAGFFGPHCSDELCPHNCFGHGACNHGACTCSAGWFGRLCDSKLDEATACDPTCRNAGRCVDGQCYCSPEFSGVDCSIRVASASQAAPRNDALSAWQVTLPKPKTALATQASDISTGQQSQMKEMEKLSQSKLDFVAEDLPTVLPTVAVTTPAPTADMQSNASVSVLPWPSAMIDEVKSHKLAALPPTAAVSNTAPTADMQSNSPMSVLPWPSAMMNEVQKPKLSVIPDTQHANLAVRRHPGIVLMQAQSQAGGSPASAQGGTQSRGIDDLSYVRRAVRAAGSAAEKLRRTAQHEFAEAAQRRVHEAIEEAHVHDKDIPGYQAPVAAPRMVPTVVESHLPSSPQIKAWEELLRQAPGASQSHNTQLPDTDNEDPAARPALGSTINFYAAKAVTCEAGCSGHGDCIAQDGGNICKCHTGWVGMLCDVPRCQSDCHGHGVCLLGECICKPGFLGKTCGNERCPDDCSGFGYCFQGKCTCKNGFEGPNCGQVRPAGLAISVKMKALPVARAPPPIDRREQSITLRMLQAKTCPSDCNQHGSCQDGTCDCATGYSGPACETYCPNECSHNGNCIEGACLCYAGFLGQDCSMKGCCNGHGTCDDPGLCVCDAGWSGMDCAVQLQCPDPLCSGHGTCTDGTCHCTPGFMGPSCSATSGGCSPPCGVNGMCNPVSKKCECKVGFIGLTCSMEVESCPNHCSNKGLCMNGKCMCGAGWSGNDCSKRFFKPGAPPPTKDVKSSGSGTDAADLQDGGGAGLAGFGGAGAAEGEEGKAGSQKSKQKLAKRMEQELGEASDGMVCGAGGACSGHGTCDTDAAKCMCEGAFYGNVCELQHCPGWFDGHEDCHGHGLCNLGECQCAPGWGQLVGKPGPNACADKVCPVGCGDHGECIEGSCVCQQGWTGPNCKDPECPGNCAGHGQCSFVSPHSPGQCVCDYGWGGAGCQRMAVDLQLMTCPNSCNGKGLCLNGMCMCNVGFSGPDCNTPVCPGNFVGPQCDLERCPHDCHGQGLCMSGVCICWNNFAGRDCKIPKNCMAACKDRCDHPPHSNLPESVCDYCIAECTTSLPVTYNSFDDLKGTLLQQNQTSGTAQQMTQRWESMTSSRSGHRQHRHTHHEVSSSTILTSIEHPRPKHLRHREVSVARVQRRHVASSW